MFRKSRDTKARTTRRANGGILPLAPPRRGGNHAVRQPMTLAGFMFAHEQTRPISVTAKARPHFFAAKQRCCGCTDMEETHESAIHSPGRQELQVVNVNSHSYYFGNGRSRAPGLVWGGQEVRASCPSLLKRIEVNNPCSKTSNLSMHRIASGAR